jgi:hypothetical protein
MHYPTGIISHGVVVVQELGPMLVLAIPRPTCSAQLGIVRLTSPPLVKSPLPLGDQEGFGARKTSV